jgi:hypothetical protein
MSHGKHAKRPMYPCTMIAVVAAGNNAFAFNFQCGSTVVMGADSRLFEHLIQVGVTITTSNSITERGL